MNNCVSGKPHRRLIVLQGDRQWFESAVSEWLAQLDQNRLIHLGQVTGESLTGTINKVLGRDYDVVVMDAFDGLDPDLLAAAGGTVVAGGALVLLTPWLNQWPLLPDPFNERIANWPYKGSQLARRFLSRLTDKILHADVVEIYSSQDTLRQLECSPRSTDSGDRRLVAVTPDQRMAVDAIVKMFHAKKGATLVLQADRGRGKSAAMGLAINQLFAGETPGIVITAPRKKAIQNLLKHCDESWRASLTFVAPDELCRQLPAADLLLVDEAAAIPLPLLETMHRRYRKTVFATTVHGYEGTGRGFALRFHQYLHSASPGWEKLEMITPIRYGGNDPLESFLFDALLLDAEMPGIEPMETSGPDTTLLQDCVIREIPQDELLEDESSLRAVFALLVQAHYQTRPTDLRHLLDGKDLSIYVMTFHNQVVAAALTVMEGGFDAQLAHEIHYARRRPKGHLVAQSLAVHAGHPAAPQLRTERVMRIVVHPRLQRQRLGSRLLGHIVNHGRRCDYVSSSFGAATAELPGFWLQQGFSPIRVGLKRDASSGSHSIIVCKGKSAAGMKLVRELRWQFSRYFPVHRRTTTLSGVADELADSLAMHEADGENVSTDFFKTDLCSFAYGNRDYEFCQYAIERLVRELSDRELSKDGSDNEAQKAWRALPTPQKQLLTSKVLDRCCWQSLIQEFHFSGKKQAIKMIRGIMRQIVEHMQIKCL